MAYIGVSPSNGVRKKHTYTATANQTSFSGAGAEGFSLSYLDSNYVDVYQNGVKLSEADYTSTTGTTVVLATGATVSDMIEIIVYDVFSVADTVSKADGGTFDGNVTMAGTITVTGNADLNGDLDVDGTTNLDVVDIDGALTQDGGAVFNEGSADVDFRVESNGNANMLFVDGGNDRVGIGAVGGSGNGLAVTNTDGGSALVLHRDFSGSNISSLTTSATLDFTITDSATSNQSIAKISPQATAGTGDAFAGNMRFFTSGNDGTATEMMRISTPNAGVFLGTTSTSGTVEGLSIRTGIKNMCVVAGGTVFIFNRNTNDGELISLNQANTAEGSISVSGNTVSYNAFSGSHWSRLADNSKPTILKGTIIETIDEMCDWYQAEFIIPATIIKDEEGNDVEDTPEITEKVSVALPDGKSVGDTMSVTHEGITYDNAKIIKEDDNKHTKCKISATADSKRVYGVFASFDNDDDTVNDMYVTAVGTHVVRINKDVTVSAGDLLSSNGDGTAKVQDDDIIRSKTIGKVLTNIKQETYDDGSYTVPCALYCG